MSFGRFSYQAQQTLFVLEKKINFCELDLFVTLF